VSDQLTYPDWFTALDRRRIDDAVATATALTILPPETRNTPGSGVIFISLSRVWPSLAVALDGVLIVLEAVASTMVRYHDRQRTADLRRWTDTLRDEVIVWAEQYTLEIGLDAFNDAVSSALLTRAWWGEPQTVTAPTMETFGTWVERHRKECDWTVDELAAKAKFHRTSVDNHSHDRVRLRTGTITKYETAFTKALGRKITWPHKLR